VAVTLRDVARHAGVSTRTVSNVVNGFPHISPAMRVKVEAALSELNYRPNLLARSLRQGRTGIITLLVPEIAVTYFSELAHEVVEQASERGCTVMIDETGGAPDRERELLDVATQSSWVTWPASRRSRRWCYWASERPTPHSTTLASTMCRRLVRPSGI
jgi:LacI family repressor for deo operon, udp, cdd, tsx, nupC, and nupG